MAFESRVLSLIDPIGGIDSAHFVCGTLFVTGDADALPAAVAYTETVLAKDGITGVVVSRITGDEFAFDFVA
jgi:hypothetical protein